MFLGCSEKGEFAVLKQILGKIRGNEEHWGLLDGFPKGIKSQIEKLLGN